MRIAGVLALVLLLGACSGESADTSDAGASDAAVPAALADGCPPRDTPLRLGGGDLPIGAVGVRLCPGAPSSTATAASASPASRLRSTQRAGSVPPRAVGEPPTCELALSEPVSALPPVPLELASARWCVGAKAGIRSAVVPDALVERLNTSPLTLVPSIRKGCVPSSYGSTIQGVTAWGDRVSVLMVGCDGVSARSGFGREHQDDVHRFEDAGVQAALEALRRGPLEKYADG